MVDDPSTPAPSATLDAPSMVGDDRSSIAEVADLLDSTDKQC
mgnify:CR=1 FL=1